MTNSEHVAVLADEKVWTRVEDQLPPEGEVVDTKIDDIGGARNHQRLIRQGRLYFFEDRSMYVYYRPTHWSAP
jgi:hypothetical protein